MIILAALTLLLVWGALPSSTPEATHQPPPPGKGDAALFMKVIDRLAAGEPYYQALGDEMRRDSYPARSPFNWRTPFHLTLLAQTGVPAATLILKLLTLAAVLATAAVLAQVGRTEAVIGTLAQMGALASAFQPQAVAVSEIWAGVLIALSVSAYSRTWWFAGALLGAGAVFIRELAAPYCVACAILSFRVRRGEAGVWIAAGLAYAAYFGIHVWQVDAHQLAGDLAHEQPWQRWNGVQFTLATIAVNGWLSFVPKWTTAVYMVLALAGTTSRKMVPQVRWALLGYVALFAIAGQPFNYYWGFVTAPLWAFGLAHAPDGLRSLISSTALNQRWRSGPTESRP